MAGKQSSSYRPDGISQSANANNEPAAATFGQPVATLIRRGDGVIAGVFCTFADTTARVTARRERDAALDASAVAARQFALDAGAAADANVKYRTLFTQCSHFAMLLSTAGVVLEVNLVTLDASGYRRDQVVGQLAWDCGWWASAPATVGILRSAVAQAQAGQAAHHKLPYHTVDGEERIGQVAIAPVFDDAGRVIYLAATGTDVTETEGVDARLRLLDAIGESTRQAIAPDANMESATRMPAWRRTMTAFDRIGVKAIICCPLVKEGKLVAMMAVHQDTPRAWRPGEVALAEAVVERCWAHIERVRAMMARQVAHMVHLINDLLDVARVNNGKVVLQVAPVDLRQVLGNLLSNAVKYTPPGGALHLSGQRCGDMVEIRLQDNGIGIPQEHLASVFDMFTQVARNLECARGGTVTAASPGLGPGSTFTVRLPAPLATAGAASGAADPVAVSAAPTGPLRILVADDNVDAADVMCALLDLGMPRMDGFEAARRMRAEPLLAHTVLVAVTGWGADADRDRTREAGFDHHLLKPASMVQVQAIVAEAQRMPGAVR